MDIFITQLARVAPNRLQPKKLKVNRLSKESAAKNIDSEQEHLTEHDTDAATFQHAKQQFSEVVDVEIEKQQSDANETIDAAKNDGDHEQQPVLNDEHTDEYHSPANTNPNETKQVNTNAIDSSIQKRVEAEGVPVPSDDDLATVVYQRPKVLGQRNDELSSHVPDDCSKASKASDDHDSDQHLDIFV